MAQNYAQTQQRNEDDDLYHVQAIPVVCYAGHRRQQMRHHQVEKFGHGGSNTPRILSPPRSKKQITTTAAEKQKKVGLSGELLSL